MKIGNKASRKLQRKAKMGENTKQTNKGVQQNPKPTLEDVQDKLYFYRLAFAVLTGILWGVSGVKGITGIISYCLISFTSTNYITSYLLGIDEGDYDKWTLLKEGFINALCLHLLIWIGLYTLYQS